MQRIVRVPSAFALIPFTGKLGQLTWLANTFDHRLDHPTTARAMMSLMTEPSWILASANVFSIRWTCRVLLAHQLLACPRPTPRNSWTSLTRNEAGLDQPTGQQVGDPHRVVYIGLAPGGRS